MLKVAIVGKPNVGKSSLFNRLIKIQKSIVDDAPGITRDRIYGNVNWLNQTFRLIDTGGLLVDDFDFKQQIEMQVKFAIDEANIILFLISYKEGIDNNDFYVSKILKKYKNKNVILVVNKYDNNEPIDNNSIYYQLNFGKPFFISCAHGIGIGDLLDQIVTTKIDASPTLESYKFCVIGKPNVGKSSFVNLILNQERVIVSDKANTTRDSIDSIFKRDNEYFTIIDTAGIRRKGKMKENVDRFSFMRVEQSIRRSDLIIIMLDASEEFSEQDEIIAGLAYKANIPSIIVVNKWDLVTKNEKTINDYTKKIKANFKFIDWAPIVFISVKEKQRINIIFDKIKELREMAHKKISSSALMDVILKAQMMNNSPFFNGGRIKINYAVQVNGQIPTFVLICNNPNYLHFSYARYLENEIKQIFGFTIVPITLFFKSKNSDLSRKKE